MVRINVTKWCRRTRLRRVNVGCRDNLVCGCGHLSSSGGALIQASASRDASKSSLLIRNVNDHSSSCSRSKCSTWTVAILLIHGTIYTHTSEIGKRWTEKIQQTMAMHRRWLKIFDFRHIAIRTSTLSDHFHPIDGVVFSYAPAAFGCPWR